MGLPDPKEVLMTDFANQFIRLEARYQGESTKASPMTLEWYRRHTTPLFWLITEFGLAIEDVVGEISKQPSNEDKNGYYLERSEIEECAARIRSWFGDCRGNGYTS